MEVIVPAIHIAEILEGEIEDKYKCGRTLGRGTFATVKLGICLIDSKQYAIKVIRKTSLSTKDRISLASEINIVMTVRHQNIVHVREIFCGKSKVCIVMELMSGGELFDRIITKKIYTEVEAKKALVQIVNAIDYCHDHGIAHRDLKPENLLYSNGTDDAVLKLADFGLSRMIGPDEMLHNVCGTPGYVAPEILCSNPNYGVEVDMWSIGVILFILLCGCPPFKDDDNKKLFAKIRQAQFKMDPRYWENISESAKHLVTSLLVINPRTRLTAKQVLSHQWCVEEARNVHLAEFNANLSSFNAKRRMKRAIRCVVIAQALKKQGAATDENHNIFSETAVDSLKTDRIA